MYLPRRKSRRSIKVQKASHGYNCPKANFGEDCNKYNPDNQTCRTYKDLKVNSFTQNCCENMNIHS